MASPPAKRKEDEIINRNVHQSPMSVGKATKDTKKKYKKIGERFRVFFCQFLFFLKLLFSKYHNFIELRYLWMLSSLLSLNLLRLGYIQIWPDIN